MLVYPELSVEAGAKEELACADIDDCGHVVGFERREMYTFQSTWALRIRCIHRPRVHAELVNGNEVVLVWIVRHLPHEVAVASVGAC